MTKETVQKNLEDAIRRNQRRPSAGLAQLIKSYEDQLKYGFIKRKK